MQLFNLDTRRFSGVFGEFSLRDLEGFPYVEYRERQDVYAELERWYSGAALESEVKTSGDAETFPVRVNPLHNAATKHVAALLGEYSDTGDTPPVRMKVKPLLEERSERAETVEHILQLVLVENNIGSAMHENAWRAQFYGGCVFKVSYDDADNSELTAKVRVDAINPKYFIGIPYHTNMWWLREAWVVQQITAEQARAYGVNDLQTATAWYIEHWTHDQYQVSINNVLLGRVVEGEEIAYGGPNPFGFVPYVYIPHPPREVSGFYGTSMATKSVQTLLKELAARLADAGDAVSDDSHGYVVMKNVRGTPQVVEIADGVPAINLGMSQQFVNGAPDPELDPLKRSQVSAPMLALVDDLYKMLRRELFLPAVADGEDEGSQRSGSTLYTRLWHLVAHTKAERAFWTSGLKTMGQMILKIMAAKELMGITEEDARLRIGVQWAAPLPRDRDELINELAVRAANNLGSIDHLLELTGDIDDVGADKELIIEWIRFLADTQAKAQQKAFQQNGGGSTPTQTRPPAKSSSK